MAIPKHYAEKIANAKTSGGGNQLSDGDFALVVKRILCKSGYKGTFLIPECDVVEAVQTHPTVLPNKPGSDVSFAWQLDGSGAAGDAAKGNAKQFLAALLNKDNASTEELMTLASQYAGESEADPDCLRARGMVIAAKTVRKAIKTGPNAGKEGAFPRFSFIPQSNEEIAARRADLDSRRR